MQTSSQYGRRSCRTLCNLAPLAFSALCSGLLYSQTVSTSLLTGKNATGAVYAPVLAVADESFALADALVRELRNGGYVLYLRHGAVVPRPSDRAGTGQWWKDCQNASRIGPEVPLQTRAIADALSRQRILVAETLSSEFCRAVDTASLLGPPSPQVTAALNDFTALRTDAQSSTAIGTYAAGIHQLLSRPTPQKSVRVLVGHALPPGVVHPAPTTLQEGHTAVFKVEPSNRFHYITTLSPGQWQWIGKQVVADSVAPSAPQVTVAPPQPPSIPLIDAAKELKGAALVQALRKGGFNLYMRHALANVGQDGNLIQTPIWWENCTIQRNLADAGRDQARKVGESIRELKIPVSQVLTAQFCRTRETGHNLGMGPIEITEDLNHQIGQRAGFDVNAARFRQLGEIPQRGSNRILISHTHGSPKSEERIMGAMQEAEIVVFQPDGKGGSEPLARVPLVEWDNLIKIGAAAQP